MFKSYALLAGIVSAIVLLGGVYGYGFINGKSSCKLKILKEEVLISEKRNEISNKRPDTKLFLEQLLDDPAW